MLTYLGGLYDPPVTYVPIESPLVTGVGIGGGGSSVASPVVSWGGGEGVVQPRGGLDHGDCYAPGHRCLLLTRSEWQNKRQRFRNNRSTDCLNNSILTNEERRKKLIK